MAVATTGPKQGETNSVQFGVFEADLTAGEAAPLRCAGVRLQSQPFASPPFWSSITAKWSAAKCCNASFGVLDTTVDFDHSLVIAVNKLREALAIWWKPRFVETLAKRGYRLIALVKSSIEHRGRNRRNRGAVLSATQHICLVARWRSALVRCAWQLLTHAQSVRKPYRVAQVTFSGHVLDQRSRCWRISKFGKRWQNIGIYFSHMDNGTPVLAVALVGNGEISDIHETSAIGAPLIGITFAPWLKARRAQPFAGRRAAFVDRTDPRLADAHAYDVSADYATWMPDDAVAGSQWK